MTPQEKDIIARAMASVKSAGITASFEAEAHERVKGRMKQFCDRLNALAPQVRIKHDSDTGFPSPSLITGAYQNIAYRAIPQGKILDRFIEALLQADAADAPVDSGLTAQAAKLVLPADIRAYVADQCPHCPAAIKQLQSLAGVSSKIRLTIIDAALFQEQAQDDGVRAVPTVLLDDQFRWSGQIDIHEVLSMGIERDPAQLSPTSLRQLIEEGAAQAVARMMVDAGKAFPTLVELLAHEKWPVRLGAMVTVEYLVETAPSLAADLVPPLVQRFETASPPAQGDMVHVLGQIPAPEARDHLQRVSEGAYEASVIEAAKEALESTEGD